MYKTSRGEATAQDHRFQRIIERNADGILIVDEDTTIRFANPAAEGLFGRTRDKLVGAFFGFPILGEDAAELDLRRQDGQAVVVEMRVVDIVWEGAACYLISLRDITERKRSEARIAHLNAVLRAMHNVQQAIARAHDRGALIQTVCEEMVRTHGYFQAWIALFETPHSRQAIRAALAAPVPQMPKIGQTASAQQAEAGTLHSSALPQERIMNCCRKALGAEELIVIEDPPATCINCPLSERYRDRGALVQCLEHSQQVFGVLTVSTPRHFVNQAEERALLQELAGDIALALYNLALEAKQREVEEALRLKDAAIATSINAIAIFDLDGRLSYVNDAFLDLWGYEKLEMLRDRPMGGFWEDPQAIREILNTLQETGNWRGELVARRRDGTPFHVQMSVSQVTRPEDRQPTALMASLVDITQRKRAEAELRRSAHLNEMLLDSLPHPAMLIRRDRTVLAANRAAREEGARVDDYCWRSFGRSAFIPEEDRQYIEAHNGRIPPGGTACAFCRLDKMLETGEAQRIPELGRFGRTWDTWWIPIDGETYLHYSIDITEQLEMERSLRESEQKLEQILQTMADGMVVVDTEGAITYANPAAEQILEVTRDHILHRYYHERAWRQIDDEGQPYPPEELPLALAMRERRTVREIEHGIIASNSEVKWLSVSAAPLLDEAGEVYGAIANFRDVTERRAIEAALHNSEQRYRTLFDHAGDAIFVHDLEGYFLDVNAVACETLGYSREALLEMTPREISEAEDAARYEEYVQQLEVEGHIVFEARHQRRDGTTFPVEINSRYIEYDGQPAILSTARDITERKEAARRIKQYAADLARSNEELEQFAYVVSHDLQEPARMVRGYMQLLERHYQGALDEKATTYLNYAVDGAERMQEMIQALLNLSRVETRGHTFVPVDVEALVERTLTLLHRTIEETGANVTYDALPTVPADAAQLAQVFQNLIANALKFHRDGVAPCVHIDAQRADGAWRFSVTDNGIGLDPDQADRIFQIFQRLHTREEYPGTGIGLALCQKIVERHGGRLWVESEPDEGATFHFTLPDPGTVMK